MHLVQLFLEPLADGRAFLGIDPDGPLGFAVVVYPVDVVVVFLAADLVACMTDVLAVLIKFLPQLLRRSLDRKSVV